VNAVVWILIFKNSRSGFELSPLGRKYKVQKTITEGQNNMGCNRRT
jgi:hypothetical protein